MGIFRPDFTKSRNFNVSFFQNQFFSGNRKIYGGAGDDGENHPVNVGDEEDVEKNAGDFLLFAVSRLAS